jgi:hypothetical protein
MPRIDIAVDTPISTSIRAQQVSSMFDVPAADRAHLEWHGELPIDLKPWQIGLIVGPSGSGKSTILRQTFGEPLDFAWQAPSVIDDFDPSITIEALARICQAVGFNTIPAWLRPYGVLSNGERFRVDLARRLLEGGDLVLCDEFTSVVDRQVAQIGAHAVAKYIRQDPSHRFVAATCHFDLEEWLQPDWILEPATMTFRWRSVLRRPALHCTIQRVAHSAWIPFSRFHYLTANLHVNARCFVLSVNGEPAAFLGVMWRPAVKADDIFGVSRLVTLPDFQGLGLAFVLNDTIASAFKAIGYRYHMPTAHPSFTRAFDRSPNWRLHKKPGISTPNLKPSINPRVPRRGFGGRPNANFAYCGPAMEDREVARRLIGRMSERASTTHATAGP